MSQSTWKAIRTPSRRWLSTSIFPVLVNSLISAPCCYGHRLTSIVFDDGIYKSFELQKGNIPFSSGWPLQKWNLFRGLYSICTGREPKKPDHKTHTKHGKAVLGLNIYPTIYRTIFEKHERIFDMKSSSKKCIMVLVGNFGANSEKGWKWVYQHDAVVSAPKPKLKPKPKPINASNAPLRIRQKIW